MSIAPPKDAGTSSGRFTIIVLTGLLAGSLDAVCATINFWIHGGNDSARIWRYVASAALGPEARTSTGPGIVALGLLFHYIVAFSFTIFYFWVYPRLSFLHRNKIVSGLLYGVFVWVVMNLAVVPLSRIGKFPATLESVITNMGILMIAIGIPIAWGAASYYRKK